VQQSHQQDVAPSRPNLWIKPARGRNNWVCGATKHSVVNALNNLVGHSEKGT